MRTTTISRHRPQPLASLLAAALLGTACGDGSATSTETSDASTGEASTDTTPTSSGADPDSTGASDLPPADFDPYEATLADIREQVAEGPVLCRTVVTRYRELFMARDPALRSIVTWNEGALAAAELLDAVPVAERGPFHCAPVVVKDNIDVAQLPTTAGVAALASSVPAAHAEIVARLVDAGAVILGKTNMPDFATDGINTRSSVLGQTVNPYDETLTVYGSSGGTAAAITASLGIVGLGTDTYGSLIQPGSATGLVAIRPTQGLVPSAGILPLMTLQDMPGPMTRTVADAAAVLTLLAEGPDARDYTAALDPAGLQGLTIGVDPVAVQEVPLLGLVPDPEVGARLDESLGSLEAGGATVVEVGVLFALLPALQGAIDASFGCMPVDFNEGFAAYLGTLGPDAPVTSLAEVIESGAYLPAVEGFLTDAAAQTDTIASSPICQQYQTARQEAQDAITQYMDDQGLDLLVYPAANQPPFPAGENPPMGWFGFQGLSSPTGLPSLTLPMGLTADGRPIGLVLLARAHREDLLVAAAYALEQQQSPRVPPPAG